MDVTVGQYSSQGQRANNEDFLGTWVPGNEEEMFLRGRVVVIADGVGGHGNGEIASRTAVEEAIKRFKETKPDATLNSTLWQMFNHANLAVYDVGMKLPHNDEIRMATTMTATVFRHDQIGIGHVGDCRAYFIHGRDIKCMTTDHTYVAFHEKMGLFTSSDAKNTPLRGGLTRSVGKDSIVPIDFVYATVAPGDYVVHMCDGVHTMLSENEILEIVTHKMPEEACLEMAGLAAQRGSQDNLSVQVCRINRIKQVTYYRGSPIYREPVKSMEGELKSGDVLDGRFEIADIISRSGMASIFKALDRETNTYIALKIPFMQYESDPAFHSRFEREEAIGLAMDHPAILKFVPVDKDKRSRPYIAMELLYGKTLDEVIRAQKPMDVEEARKIIVQLCDALAHMHAKDVVHRDLKPANIMLCNDGTLRIMDFGIAKAAGMRRITFVGFSPAMGTPDYMAPEQVKGRRGDERTDIYSLGAILYEMVTGEAPFSGENPFVIMQARLTGDPEAPRNFNSKISPQLEEVILHAMEREPVKRYPNAAALKADLEDLQNVTLTGRHERLQKPQQWKSNWQKIGLYAALAAIVPLLLIILYLLGHMGKK